VLNLDAAIIERLAKLRGIGEAYHDYRGELKHFSLETKLGILRAMGCAVDEPSQLAASLAESEAIKWRRFLPPVAVSRGARMAVDINVTAQQFGAIVVWSVNFEDGSHRVGTTSSTECVEVWRGEVGGSWVTRRRLELPFDVPKGYHELEAKIAGGTAQHCRLIVSPAQCYEPEVIIAGRRLWGISVQLYTLRSQTNWGIGDFYDLKRLIRWGSSCGAGFIGLNPLHALAPADPDRCSPYSPSNRHFLNVLYIAVPAVPEFEECAAVRQRLTDLKIIERLKDLRSREHVDYAGVAELKFEILALLYQHFRDRHLSSGSERASRFRAFEALHGRPLQLHARFDALDRYFRAMTGCASGWLSWPHEYRDVDGEAASRFAIEHPAEIEFYAYLQWLAHEQLASAQDLTRELGMPIGLYGDYAVGSNPAGSETWINQGRYALTAEIGAPPDPLALRGQGWGIPPQDPFALQAERLEGFISLIRSQMRCFGALRLDHVMSLCRLWWVPRGFSPVDGAYVHYPLQQLLTVLALESERSACLVVGEDLGVVPDEMRKAMPELSLYHYKVLLFEKVEGRFRRPGEYVRRALATVTTHDMPTIRSFWEGRDIELRSRLNLYPSIGMQNEVLEERQRDRHLLLTALHDEGLTPIESGAPLETFTQGLADSLHLYLARSSTTLVALQIEDLLGMTDPVNVPGTDREYPNWQRKLSAEIETMAESPEINGLLERINQARG
jgi:4-alpha-glucanotransferase